MVRMLCVRSASLIRITRTSSATATSILRQFSTVSSSVEENFKSLIFVTPCTMWATSLLNSFFSSSAVTPVSSTVSCSRPAQMVSSSILKSSRICATAQQWLKYGSPVSRFWSLWAFWAKR